VLLSLIDLGSGDTVTFAILDSYEVHDPHALLALTTDPVLTVHGPFNGDNAANDSSWRWPRMASRSWCW
jgi:hypothetical protein